MSILYTITEKTSIEYLQLIEYFSTNLLHFEKRCDIMIASKGKPDAFSGKRSEKRDRTHKIFYFRDSMSRTRAVRQFRSGECAPQGVAMPCGKGGTMGFAVSGRRSKATAFGHSPARRARRKGGCIGRRDPIEKRSGDVCRRRVRRLGISARTAPKVSRIRKDSDCGVSPSGA